MCSIDREANTVGVSVDFGPMQTVDLGEHFRGVSFDTEMPVRIGQDGTGNYGYHLAALIDELVITDRALTDEDVAALKAFYVGE